MFLPRVRLVACICKIRSRNWQELETLLGSQDLSLSLSLSTAELKARGRRGVKCTDVFERLDFLGSALNNLVVNVATLSPSSRISSVVH